MALSQYDLPTNLTVESGFDASIVSETTTWLLQTIQGETQLAITRDPNALIYFNRTIATITGSTFLLISIIPIMMLVYDSLSNRLRPRRIPLETKSSSLLKTFILSSLMGVTTVVIFIVTISAGSILYGTGTKWPNFLFGTDLIVSYYLGLLGLLIPMLLFFGMNQTKLSLSSVGVEKSRIRDSVFDIVKSLAIIVIPIIIRNIAWWHQYRFSRWRWRPISSHSCRYCFNR